MSALSVAEVLSKAADLIEPQGAWMQEEFCNEMFAAREDIQAASCWCAAGAIAHVIEGDGPDGERWLLDNHISDLLGLEGVSGLVGWNDVKGRTQAEVVAKLREAAALAREQS